MNQEIKQQILEVLYSVLEVGTELYEIILTKQTQTGTLYLPRMAKNIPDNITDLMTNWLKNQGYGVYMAMSSGFIQIDNATTLKGFKAGCCQVAIAEACVWVFSQQNKEKQHGY